MSKVGLIVEGDSDELFFNSYFKPNFLRNLKVRTSGTKGTCKILNEKTIISHVKALRLQNCSKIFILIDLKTQCDSITYECIKKLKKWYKSKIKISNDADVIVSIVSKDIEAWMMSAWEISDSKSKNDLKRKFESESNIKKSLSEKELFKKFLASKKDINYENNESLKHFLCKLEVLAKSPCK
ncbi:MAG: hypothetical protein L3I99_01225 [Sulfurimonas sp.]|nr:hypothetical protein [Sulfurimonas sp.]